MFQIIQLSVGESQTELWYIVHIAANKVFYHQSHIKLYHLSVGIVNVNYPCIQLK